MMLARGGGAKIGGCVEGEEETGCQGHLHPGEPEAGDGEPVDEVLKKHETRISSLFYL